MKARTIFRLSVGLSGLLFLTSCNERVANVVQPAIITEPSLVDTDDPAIWLNEQNPEQSLILGTDKGNENGGIYVYDLNGKIDHRKTILNLKRPNNIDIEYGFDLNGKKTDIAVFTERGSNQIRVLSLPDVKLIDKDGINVFEGDSLREPMGISLYKEPKTGNVYAIVSRKTGPSGTYLWEYLLYANPDGTVSGKKVRAFGEFSGKKEIEAIVVDDVNGYVYYSDEKCGIRQYYASPDSSNRQLSLFATTGVTCDHEGLSIYSTSDTTGYILLSDQQANQFQIFEREGFQHKLLKIVKVAAKESDGSEVIPVPLNSTFAHGLFVVMSTDRTFHFYRWEDIAGKDLKVMY
jgi:3-phytase